MMGIVQQQSVWGELDEKWKNMRAEWRDNKELIKEQGASDHGLWVSHPHPAFFGHRVDYTLGSLDSKLVCSLPKFFW